MKSTVILINFLLLLAFSFFSCRVSRQDDHRGYYPDRDYKEHHYKDKRHTYVPIHRECIMTTNIPISRRPKNRHVQALKDATAAEIAKTPTLTEAPKDVPKGMPAADAPAKDDPDMPQPPPETPPEDPNK